MVHNAVLWKITGSTLSKSIPISLNGARHWFIFPGFQVTLTRGTFLFFCLCNACDLHIARLAASTLRTVADYDIQGRGEKLLRQRLLRPDLKQADGKVLIYVCSLHLTDEAVLCIINPICKIFFLDSMWIYLAVSKYFSLVSVMYSEVRFNVAVLYLNTEILIHLKYFNCDFQC